MSYQKELDEMREAIKVYINTCEAYKKVASSHLLPKVNEMMAGAKTMVSDMEKNCREAPAEMSELIKTNIRDIIAKLKDATEGVKRAHASAGR